MSTATQVRIDLLRHSPTLCCAIRFEDALHIEWDTRGELPAWSVDVNAKHKSSDAGVAFDVRVGLVFDGKTFLVAAWLTLVSGNAWESFWLTLEDARELARHALKGGGTAVDWCEEFEDREGGRRPGAFVDLIPGRVP